MARSWNAGWADAAASILIGALAIAEAPSGAGFQGSLRVDAVVNGTPTGSLELTGAVAGADILINNERVGAFPTPALLAKVVDLIDKVPMA